MESIAARGAQEMTLFKHGSGAGSDNSPLRSTHEYLSGGGRPSGPVSFMHIYDAIASVTKSGGRNRRAAKIEILRCDHPDIDKFIDAKPREEQKAHDLINQGWPAHFNPGGAYGEVRFQNSNLSVRVTDKFMELATESVEPGDWQTIAVTTGTAFNTHGDRMPVYDASELLDKIAEGTWFCGDPGMQYDDTIQAWHTCPNSGRINTSNPCAEFVFLDGTACNLASLNLMKFRTADGFDTERFSAACRLFIIAQEILVGHAGYPSESIAYNSWAFRPLGLGYANLGALLMAEGLPYDSDAGRSLCGAITALMTGAAYTASAELAQAVGPFHGYEENKGPMLAVIAKHRTAAAIGAVSLRSDWARSVAGLWAAAGAAWDDALSRGQDCGYRNAQTSLLAPTGTIALYMDCDTTGIEPAIALVSYKTLAGGGTLRMVNQTVGAALEQLGYPYAEQAAIKDYIEAHDTIEGAPGLKPEHLPVFDCAFPPPQGGRSLSWEAHLKMLAAVQPGISGSSSKTVNMCASATVADIRAAYVMGWKLGLKCVAIYRDGCKWSQPLNTKKEEPKSTTPPLELALAPPSRRKLPRTRPALTHHFTVGGHEGYFTVGLYPDTMQPGELFITMSKEGSTIAGLMDTIGIQTSFLLQYGVPLADVAAKLAHVRFEPSGFTGDPDVPLATSIIDYVFRWLALRYTPDGPARYGSAEASEPAPLVNRIVTTLVAAGGHGGATGSATGNGAQITTTNGVGHGSGRASVAAARPRLQSDAPLCDTCGMIMVRAGRCYGCQNCGATSGCG
jgi:ribonucleoside-diphosphate reductase alpha chain